MSLSAGTRLGPYEIIALLGVGGMGEVYRARDTKLNRDVAIKVLPELVAHDPERLARFEREAKVLAALNHPNIAHIHGFEDSTGVPALVMEMVDGPTLAARIALGPIPLDEALPLARQIAEALEAAHEQGIIHRDLKPANVKVREDRTVKVLDFGLAKALEPSGAGASARSGGFDLTASPAITSPALMTTVGTILGTAAYMSPEQAKGRPADKRSDIWSFGCVLFEMLTGRRTFEGEDVSDTLAFVITKDVDWSRLPDTAPASIRRLLRRCLMKDRNRRLADIADARLELDEACLVSEVPAALGLPAAATPSLLKRAIPLVTTALATAAVTSIAWSTFREAPRPPTAARFQFLLGGGERFTGVSRPTVAISPDGAQIVFVANDRLYTRSMSDLSARHIPGTESPPGTLFNPAFSPDGRSVAFYSGTTGPAGGYPVGDIGRGAIKKISITGGAATTVCEASAPLGMSWSAEGIVFAERGVKRVSANGGTPEQIVSLKDNEAAQSPHMLPGGHAVLFTLATDVNVAGSTRPTNPLPPTLAAWDRAQIVVQSLTTGQRKTLVQGGSSVGYLPTGHLIFARGGVLFAVPFDSKRLQVTGEPIPVVEGVLRNNGSPSTGLTQAAVSDTGTLIYVPGPTSYSTAQQRLVLIDRRGDVEPLRLVPGPYAAPRISPDGTRVAYFTDDGKDANIWIYDLSGASSTRQLTFGGRNRYPVWAPDGQRVAFQSDRDGDAAIFWQRADGTAAAERLTRPESGTAHVPESWSPDGKTILFDVMKGTTAALWTFSLPDRRATPFGDVQSESVTASAFSPNGRWVAYGTRPSREPNVSLYVQPFPPTGAKYLITSNGFRPLWSPDGTELFFGRRGQSFVVGIATQPAFSFGEPVELPIRRLPPPGLPEREYDVTRDGRRFIFAISSEGLGAAGIGDRADQIDVVLNWQEELKQRVPTR
jgi:eukaryotic-like serine/threonine-protein kinase